MAMYNKKKRKRSTITQSTHVTSTNSTKHRKIQNMMHNIYYNESVYTQFNGMDTEKTKPQIKILMLLTTGSEYTKYMEISAHMNINHHSLGSLHTFYSSSNNKRHFANYSTSSHPLSHVVGGLLYNVVTTHHASTSC